MDQGVRLKDAGYKKVESNKIAIARCKRGTLVSSHFPLPNFKFFMS